jgi:hypothetical protein
LLQSYSTEKLEQAARWSNYSNERRYVAKMIQNENLASYSENKKQNVLFRLGILLAVMNPPMIDTLRVDLLVNQS